MSAEGNSIRPLPEVLSGNTEPLFNIGVVARMTGVSMATLRAWERRYEFPDSERTAGGHRLYSERDVLRLRWVKERIDEGMQTAQAINALRHQETTGHLLQPLQAITLPESSFTGPTDHLVIYQTRLFDALSHRNFQSSEVVLSEALAASTADDVILEVISPTLAQMGDAWEAGEISIAVEHLTTNYLRQKLMMWMLSGAPPRAVPPIILACAPTEWHEGSLLVLGALLRRRRWPVAYLGQSLPLDELANIVHDSLSSLVVVIAMTDGSAQELSEWPKYLPEAFKNGLSVFGFGGRIFVKRPEWRQRVAGMYLGDNFREAVEKIEKILGNNP